MRLAAVSVLVAALAAVCAVPSAEARRPANLQFEEGASEIVSDAALKFDGAAHDVVRATCSGSWVRWPIYDSAGILEAPLYEYFRCAVVLRFIENGGYNDRRRTIWIRLDQSLPRSFRFEWAFTRMPIIDATDEATPFFGGRTYCTDIGSLSVLRSLYYRPKKEAARTVVAHIAKSLYTSRRAKLWSAWAQGCRQALGIR